jgi:hypothetical protein
MSSFDLGEEGRKKRPKGVGVCGEYKRAYFQEDG